MKTLIALASALLAVCISTSSSAQSKGSLTVAFATASLDSIVSNSQKNNYNQASLEGFRVQIYSGSGINSKKEAEAAQVKFQTAYPSEKVYLLYNAPFWRVRVGDYRFRSEGLTMLNKAKSLFPGSYIVRDNAVRKKAFR